MTNPNPQEPSAQDELPVVGYFNSFGNALCKGVPVFSTDIPLVRLSDAQARIAALTRERDEARKSSQRYNFLLGFLIERGVLTEKRYGHGTWSLQGIYGVDDSGLRGAGRTPDEAIDNAIVAVNLDSQTARKFWSDTHAALKSAQLEARDGSADAKLLDWFDANPGHELSQSAWGPEGDQYGWCVHRVSGSRNDREWRLVGQGDTVRIAVNAAIAASTTKETP